MIAVRLTALLLIAGAASVAAAQPAISRGPYLQAATPSQVTVRWRTTTPTAGRVRWGAGALTQTADDARVQTDHAVVINGLTAATAYHYDVGTPDGALAGGDQGFAFTTPPPAGPPVSTRLWTLGDSGTASASALRVRDAFLAYTGSRAVDVWMLLGDNSYLKGLDDEYQKALFDFFPDLLRTTAFWPVIGNADVLCCEGNPQTAPYFQVVSPPTMGEAGGVPSGSLLYYSFDHAHIHFVVLDSMLSDRSPGGPMLTWLRRDLAAYDRRPDPTWLIAAWHHTPYTAGEHDSDSEIAHIQMRQNAVPILEAHGVDLVLGGHSHDYERTCLLDGHYGPSTTLTPAMKKDPGTGRPEESGAYHKAPGPHGGTVYVVQGNAGQLSAGPLNHPAMVVSALTLGSLVIDVDATELRATYLRDTGAIDDHFVIRKIDPRPDGGVIEDDAGVDLDDAGVDAAADAAVDAETAVDAGATDAAFDAPAGDAGAIPSSSGGCGCALGGARAPAGGGLLAIALALLIGRRRRTTEATKDR